MAATSFIRNELILGERLWKETCSRRAKEQLFEIRDRMNQVIYEYDISEEAYSKLDTAGDTAEMRRSESGRQQEILDHITEYKEACTERSAVLTALNFFFSSYCEEEGEEGEGETGYGTIYHPEFGNEFDTAYLSARSALERLKFLNSQIVSLATNILNKKKGMESMRSDWLDGTEDLGNKSCCKATLDAAQTEFERILAENEAKLALNSRLKKYVQNQEEAVEVCQSIARRLAVDNGHMLASLTSSLKDVKTLSRDLEKHVSMVEDLKEKYKLPPTECQIVTDQEITARNLKSYRDLKKYETHVREIELDFTRLEHLSKLLDAMKLQLHQANKRKELTEEQFRGRLAKLRSDISDETKMSKLNLRTREDNGDLKKGKKRKKKKSVKKSMKSSFSSTTTIGDGTESMISEISDSAVLSPVSNISETVTERCLPRKEMLRNREKTSSNISSDSVFLPPNPRIERSNSRQKECDSDNHLKQEVVTALQSHSSPTITYKDPLFSSRNSKTLRASEAP